MKLSEQHIIRKNNINYKTIEDLSIKSNNLYNTALFIIRQHYFNRKGKQFISDICDSVDYDYVNYYDLNRILKQTKNSHYINADINGSFNIMRKYLNVASAHILNGRCRGLVVNPYLVTFK